MEQLINKQYFKYGSMAEFFTHAETVTPETMTKNGKVGGHCKADRPEDYKNSWTYGQDTKGEYKRRMRTFSPRKEIVDKYKEEQRKVTASPKMKMIQRTLSSKRRRKRWNRDDGEISITKYMTGADDYYKKKMKKEEKNAVTLAINPGFSASASEESFINLGIDMYKLCLAFQYAGISTRIYVIDIGKGMCQGDVATVIPLKHENEPAMSMNKLAMVGHPAFLRDSVFLTEAVNCTRSFSWSMGGAGAAEQDLKDALKIDYMLGPGEPSADAQIDEILRKLS